MQEVAAVENSIGDKTSREKHQDPRLVIGGLGVHLCCIPFFHTPICKQSGVSLPAKILAQCASSRGKSPAVIWQIGVSVIRGVTAGGGNEGFHRLHSREQVQTALVPDGMIQ